MIRLFDKDETNFDSNGLGVLDSEIKENVVEERMNGIYNFDFAYLSKGKHASQLEGDMIIKAPTPDGDQLFRVYKVTKNIGFLEVDCYHIFYDLAGNFIEDINIVSQSGQAAITHFGTGLQYATRFKFVSNIVGTNSARMVRLNAVQALLDSSQDNSFLSRWGGEIKRDNFTVYMNDVRGNDKGFEIRHGKNLTGYEANIDYSTVVTRIMPYGYNGLMLPEKYVDSPLRDKYAFTRIKKIEYTNIKAIDPDATSNDESAVPLEEAYKLLRQAAELEYSVNKVDIPTSNFKVTFKNLSDTKEYADFKALEKVDPWDYVTVIADNLDIKSRMISYKYDAITKAYKEVELGNYVPSFTDIGSKVDHATNIANQANDTAKHASASADGKNTIYRDVRHEDIVNPVNGDTCFEKNGDKEEIWIYNGKSVPPSWELIVDDATGEEVRQNVDAAQKEAEEAKKQADDAVNQANQAVADAGFAKQQVIDVDKTANQAKSDAAAAGQQAKDALTNAGTALTNAKTALDNVTKLDQTVKTEVTNINGQLAQKVNQITFDTLKGTVTSQATLINQNNAAIQLKADLSLVNTIKQTVANNTAAIDLNSKEIKLKASQSTVDSLNGTVKNLDAEQKIQAGQIAQTVSKTELTSKLNGYATQTWTQGQIKTTADQINLSVISLKTEVENNGAENLIQNSSFKLGKAGWSGWEGPYIHDPVVETYHSKPYTAVYFGQNKQPYADLIHDGKIPLTPSTSYVFQIKTRSLIKNHPVTYIQEYDAAGKVINDHAFITNVNSPDYITNVQKFTTSVAAEYGVLRIRAQPGDQFMASELMLTEGTIVPKSWYPSSMDNATTADFASLEITIKGIQSTVATKANQSQVTQQAGQINSLVTSVNALNTEYSQVQQTIKGIQTTVGNKADKSQVTQLANQITSTVGSMSNPNLIMNGGYPTSGNHWSGSSDFHVTTHGFYRRGTLFVLNNNSSNEQTIGTERVKVVAGAKYTISMIVFGGSNVASYDIWFLGRKNGSTTNFDISTLVAGAKKPNPSLAEHPNWTFKMPDVDEGYIRIDNNGSTNAPTYSGLYFTEVKLEKGEVATPYVQSAESSEIIQTKEMINLRVQKGDVINQINISPESILIAGQKVHITGQTSIDNAVIKDAMIANVTADKITAGTLNAANVDVINLNANNITTGTIRGANLSMNLNTGEVVFQKGFITSADGNIRFDLDKSYFRSLDYNQNGFELSNGAFYLFNKGWNGVLSGSEQYLAGNITGGRTLIWSGIDINGSEGLDLSVYDSKTSTLGASISLGKAGGSGKDINALDVSASDIGIGNNGNFIVNNYDGYFSVNSPQIKLTSKKATKVIGGMDITGNFNVVLGSKNAVHPTSDGLRATPAYETAESYLGDIGESATDDDCKKIITMDRLFWEIINTDYEYQVFITPYNNATIWVEQRNPDSFVVRSNKPNAQFGWELKAKRRGYEKERLVKSNISYEEFKNMYESRVKTA